VAWIEVASLFVAVLAVLCGALATRQWGNRRRRVLFTSRVRPLATDELSDDDLYVQVTYRGSQLMDAHQVTVSLKNIGPADVTSAHFDGGEPLVVDLGCTTYSMTNSVQSDAVGARSFRGERSVEWRPALLKRGDTWTIDVIVSGKPWIIPFSPLADTTMVVAGPKVSALDDTAALSYAVVAAGAAVTMAIFYASLFMSSSVAF
jgi:hypothetical protein